MKGIFLDDNMSNLTSASNEASLSSSSNRNIETGTMYPPPQMQQQHQSFASVPISTNNQTQNKKKRNLPGNPDPEAEVIALSPKSLMATNRFMCEICNKGFQRDQNLQLHRRGHNLPWKLKQKSKLEVIRKKVYVCPEPSCVHHEPSRALGDLTGIKKHYSRKHGEKKWKCDKCSKRYAVQSDWKAHSKICGTREYRCDCGTLFSRRDSFITHRAFCDALAEETGRFSSSTLNHLPLHLPASFPLKTEPQLLLQHPQLSFNIGSSTTTSTPHINHQLPSWLNPHPHHQPQQENPNPNININSNNNNNNLHLPSPSSHMSATALLQKAAQMGVTMSNPAPPSTATPPTNIILPGSHQTLQHDHMCAPLLSPHHHHHPNSGLSNLSSSDHNNHIITTSSMDQLLHHPNSLTSTSIGSTNIIHDQIFNAMFTSTKTRKDINAIGNHELTRDFLGLQGFPNIDPTDQHEFLNMTGLDHMSQMNPNQNQNHNQNQNQNQNRNRNQIPWQG